MLMFHLSAHAFISLREFWILSAAVFKSFAVVKIQMSSAKAEIFTSFVSGKSDINILYRVN